MPPVRPKQNFFCTRGEYFTMSNGFFNFNFLALLLSKISGRHSGGKILTCAQVLGYIYIIVNFRLRSSIHVGLTVRSLYN